MPIHPQCAAVRMVDRCCECNPGYSDDNQTYAIYLDVTKNGVSLDQAEESYARSRR